LHVNGIGAAKLIILKKEFDFEWKGFPQKKKNEELEGQLPEI